MTIITRDMNYSDELEIEVLGTKSKSILKKALKQAFGFEKGEYLAAYGMISDGQSASIVLDHIDAKQLKTVL